MTTERLGGYVDSWWQAIDDFTSLLEQLTAEQWSAATDLPGWDVHALAAHTAHLEALRAGGTHDEVEIGSPAHVRSSMQTFTEQGVVARRDRTPDELINEIRSSATTVHTDLLGSPPEDADAPAPGLFGAIGWSTGTLLRNRPLDVWMHEQDVRRAVGNPGNLDSPAARHTSAYLAESLGYVLAKKAGLEPGTTVLLDVAGQEPVAATVRPDGRGELLDQLPAEPDVRLSMDREAWIVLAGGRRSAEVSIEGDETIGRRVVDNLAITP